MTIDPTQAIIFKELCLKWVDRLGLGEWELIFKHEKLEDSEAHTTADIKARQAIITISLEAETDLNELALHEVLHILICKLSEYARNFVSEGIIEEEEHVIIQHLVHCLKN